MSTEEQKLKKWCLKQTTKASQGTINARILELAKGYYEWLIGSSTSSYYPKTVTDSNGNSFTIEKMKKDGVWQDVLFPEE